MRHLETVDASESEARRVNLCYLGFSFLVLYQTLLIKVFTALSSLTRRIAKL